MGYRVRAATHRIVQRGESRSEVLQQGSAYSVGTVRCFCPGAGKHLVVFDDALLQPQWVQCNKSTIDVLFGSDEASAPSGGNGNSDAVTPYLCAGPPSLESIAHNTNSDSTSNMRPSYAKQCDCVLCVRPLTPGSFKQCEDCGLKCHTYCATEEAALTAPNPSNNSNSGSSSNRQWNHSTSVPWKCWNCQSTCCISFLFFFLHCIALHCFLFGLSYAMLIF